MSLANSAVLAFGNVVKLDCYYVEGGLTSFLKEIYDETLDQHIEHCLNVLKIAEKGDHYGSNFLQTSKPLIVGDQVPSILFSVPGSGKTQYVYDLFSNHWGHYMVSGRVSQPSKGTETLLEARYRSASLDTQFLYQFVDTVDRLDQERQWKAWQTLSEGTDHHWEAWQNVIGKPDEKHLWKGLHTLFDASVEIEQMEASHEFMSRPNKKNSRMRCKCCLTDQTGVG